MSNNTYFIREYTKTNLADDLMELFPKLKHPIYITRSNGTFSVGIILHSNFMKNHYFIFSPKYNSWFIQTCFYNSENMITFKYIDVESLKFSNFSESDIKEIIEALNKGVRGNIDFTNTSPDFHPINHNINEFEKMFARKNTDVNPEFNPDIFLNIPPLKI